VSDTECIDHALITGDNLALVHLTTFEDSFDWYIQERCMEAVLSDAQNV
jgi:hypothetical protein